MFRNYRPQTRGDEPIAHSQRKPSAWLLQCLKEHEDNNHSMDNCLVSYCSLRRTTDPENIVLSVDGTDVVFLKNSSRMLNDYEPFASIRDMYPEKVAAVQILRDSYTLTQGSFS